MQESLKVNSRGKNLLLKYLVFVQLHHVIKAFLEKCKTMSKTRTTIPTIQINFENKNEISLPKSIR